MAAEESRDTKRIRELVEIFRQLGLAAVIGGTADAVVDGTRLLIDVFGIAVGIIFLGVAVWLTGKGNGDTL
ncbi:MAG: hypothetical protein HYT87_07205 [Nitrospirae bacterium]|nr:hypothetical protein [Nitrospirota bacterium]